MKANSVTGKNWILKKYDQSDVSKISENYSLKEIVARLLSIRKKNIKNIDLFLNPTIKNNLPNPLKLKDMKNAINRTFKSIKRNDSSNHITVVASRNNFYFIYIFFKVTRYRIKDNEKHFNI